MTAQTKAILKTYFETGDRPTATQFEDLIDTIPGVAGVLADADIPAAIARDAEVTAAIGAHAIATDPHADRAYADSAASSAIGTHNTSASAHRNIAPGGATVSDQQLKDWAAGGGYELTAITYNVTYPTVISTATVKWPDGSAGTLTVTAQNTTYLRETAYTITHTDSGKTVTQAAVTLNTDGNITVKPALTVA
jgi:hypothetical protein